MILCKDCFWWGKESPLGILRHCECSKVGDEGHVSDGAMDGEAYQGIFTGPNFGCVHGRIKPK